MRRVLFSIYFLLTVFLSIALGLACLFVQKSKHYTKPDNMCIAYMSTCFDNYYLLQGIRYIHTNLAAVKTELFILYLKVFVEHYYRMLVKIQKHETWVKDKSLNKRNSIHIWTPHMYVWAEKFQEFNICSLPQKMFWPRHHKNMSPDGNNVFLRRRTNKKKYQLVVQVFTYIVHVSLVMESLHYQSDTLNWLQTSKAAKEGSGWLLRLRGHSTTTLTKFYQISTTYPPWVDNYEHFTKCLPFAHLAKSRFSTDHLRPTHLLLST